MRERWREKRGRERRLAGQRGWRWTKIKRDAGSTQTVGEQWHERGELEITHRTGTSEEAQNILTSSHTHTHTHTHTQTHKHKPTCMHADTYARRCTTHTNKDTLAVGNHEHSQRLDNKEKSVASRTSKHNYHHSSAYTGWPLLPL